MEKNENIGDIKLSEYVEKNKSSIVNNILRIEHKTIGLLLIDEVKYSGLTIYFGELDIGKILFFDMKNTDFSIRFQACKIDTIAFNGKLTICCRLHFVGSTFMGKADFYHLTFVRDVDFYCSHFYKMVSFNNSIFKKDLSFVETNFHSEASFHSTFMGKAVFFTSFFDAISFSSAKFYNEVHFSSTFFKEAYFDRMNFYEDVKFDKSEFIGLVNFSGSKFNKTTSFDSVNFRIVPIFSGCSMKGDANFVNTNLSFTFDSLKNNIDNLKNELSKPFGKYTYLKSANNIKDSFRVIKNNLIKQNNPIEASKYRVFELYAEEIKLGYEIKEIEKQTKQLTTQDKTPIESENTRSKESLWIEKFQLMFYRLTSDHHTDLAKIFNNVVLLIALFGVFTYLLEGTQIDLLNLKQESKNIIFQSLESIGFFIFVIGIFISLVHIYDFYFSKNKQDKFNTWFWLLIFSYLYIASVYMLYFIENQLVAKLIAIIPICLGFVLSYLYLMLNQNLVLNILSYGVCLIILVCKPASLLPFLGKLIDTSSQNNIPAIQSLSVVYLILMFLMIFSLQKTARKNSIVPS